ncbi:MAG: DNA-directed RNA polymerase subunit alpha [Candidatus Omnitrophica bacterium]|nr:DNA-directed RNA polymerase subunit alpha [Candidatus Omnitrophota bacterium]MBU2044568.1 DNA-directed RNA polymerase subunit alpha [Candidatus Omnitrophota bacterium]MBU2265860.1 DNA-directed RNA polymerase subunit alpha [Candidatus Omnitrophota bacterium]MBU2474184.1 DNA-directed RNA polymerase subunit alpha [Candidatus Omnitrophota bacterium]
MGITWRDFQFPKRVIVEQESYSPTYGKIIAEPLERGYGVTLGNALRRVLLSSIEGTAVTSIKIEGVAHEFSSIEGVFEDIPEIILNIKNLVLRSYSRTPKKIYIKAEGEKKVTAKDVVTNETIEVINPDLHIATLTSKKSKLEIEMEVGRGRGFVPAEINKREGMPLGVIPIDSIFTPVKRVAFKVENTRVGKRTDYDKLILDIFTNASIEPKEALIYAAKVMSKHLELFFTLGELPEDDFEELTPEEAALYEKLKIPVSELELSVRSANCLREANIKTLADLVEKTEPEILSYRNFGKKSLNEVGALLKTMGISFGMKIDRNKLTGSK